VVLVTGVLSPYQNEANATTSEGEGGDTGGEGDNNNGEVSPPASDGDQSSSNNEGNTDSGNDNNNDEDTTSTGDNDEVLPSQDSTRYAPAACHPVESGVPSYTDDDGCLVPCPPPSTDSNEANNTPEECPQASTLPTKSQEQTGTIQEPQQQQFQGVLRGGIQSPFEGPPGPGFDLTSPPPPPIEGQPPAEFDPNAPLTSDQKSDSDGDGIINAYDNCPAHSNEDQKDTDGDGTGDLCDGDSTDADVDGDGVVNSEDNCLSTPNPDQKDTNGKYGGDACDLSDVYATDEDLDGVPGTSDNCPHYPNAEQTDIDKDGEGDMCDLDWVNSEDGDGDGIDTQIDNCRFHPNSDQKDADDDGKGDVCDTVDLSTAPPPGLDVNSSPESKLSLTEQGLCDDDVDNDKDGLTDIQDKSDCPSAVQSKPREGFDPFASNLVDKTTTTDGGPLVQSDQAAGQSSDLLQYPQSPIKKGQSSNFDPGTRTVPASPEEGKGKECVTISQEECNFPYEYSQDEICRNGIDDDRDGIVDEDPYCTEVSGKSEPRTSTDDQVLEPIPSQGPSPFGP
jgi:hypothetical protein